MATRSCSARPATWRSTRRSTPRCRTTRRRTWRPIVLVANAPLVMVTGSSSPYKTLADAVNAAKAKPGAGQLRLARQRHRRSPDQRAVPEGGRREDPARALQGRQPGAHRRDQRQRRALHVVGADADRPDQAGQAARAGRHFGQASRRPSGRADDQRVGLQGLRRRHLVRPPGAGRHAEGRRSPSSTPSSTRPCSSPNCARSWATKAPTRPAARPSSSPR